ncbi:MAG: peptide deformylase [Clostridium sp.]
MGIREIVIKGHPSLSKISESVSEIDNEIKSLVEDLKDTLYSTSGIGLAAPQIGINKRVIYIDLRDESIEPILLINPEIVLKKGMQDSEEGCLSYPGYCGKVERPKRIEVKGIDENGQEKNIYAEGLLCRAFCHEIDHLDGIMYNDKAYEVYERN